MTLQWKDPEESCDPRRVLTAPVLAELRANPGRWALIRTYRTRRSGVAHEIKHPPDIELRGINRSHTPPITELYARAIKGSR